MEIDGCSAILLTPERSMIVRHSMLCDESQKQCNKKKKKKNNLPKPPVIAIQALSRFLSLAHSSWV